MTIERMQKARTGLIISEPFFGTLAMRLDLVEDPKTATHRTDGKRLCFNPAWAAEQTMEHLEAAVAHQVASCAFGHHLRRAGRDDKQWQAASDYAVNAELKRSGFHLPEGSLYDAAFDGMHAEAIYAMLEQQRQEKQQDGGDGSGSGSSSKAPSGDPGQPDPQGDESPTGRVDDATNEEGDGPADEAEMSQQEAEWQVASAQAAQIARGAGKLPGGIEMMVDNFINARVDWREALQRYITSRAKDDHNWSRPNRRYMPDVYMPTLDSPRVGPIAFALDWSGSCINRAADFISEVEEARNMVRPERVIVMIFDTQVRQVLEFTPDEPIDLSLVKARAGGGTSFDGPAVMLDKMDVRPEALIFLTDLDSSVFGPEPMYPVLWVSTQLDKAPYGEVILMRP